MPDKVTVSYAVKRSGSYQSVDVGLSIERELRDGETMEAAFKRTMREIAPLVENEADAALRDVVRLSNQM